MAREASIKNLTNAKRAKNDEFYTQYIDIQKRLKSIWITTLILFEIK
jgi:hypothetical protein